MLSARHQKKWVLVPADSLGGKRNIASTVVSLARVGIAFHYLNMDETGALAVGGVALSGGSVLFNIYLILLTNVRYLGSFLLLMRQEVRACEWCSG